MNSEEKQSLIKSVNEASPDRLRQFIINQAQYDPSFFQDVTAQFGELDTDAEFAKTKKLIQSTFAIIRPTDSLIIRDVLTSAIPWMTLLTSTCFDSVRDITNTRYPDYYWWLPHVAGCSQRRIVVPVPSPIPLTASFPR